jgi:hypothetical protein
MNAHSLPLARRWRLVGYDDKSEEDAKATATGTSITAPKPVPPLTTAQLAAKVPVKYLTTLLRYHVGEEEKITGEGDQCAYVIGLVLGRRLKRPPDSLKEGIKVLETALGDIFRQTVQHMQDHGVSGEDAGVTDYFAQHHDEILENCRSTTKK